METIQIAAGINLHAHTTKKFKTNVVCILLRRPLRREEATLNALIAMILGMACAKYPSAEDLAAQTERMYGAAYSCNIVKKGEEQIIQFLLEYLPKTEAKPGIASAEAFGFIREVMFNPLVVDGGFSPDITEGEKRVLHAQIAARVNHKAEYARYRFLEEMCSSEAFAIAGDGYAEDIEGITPRQAYEHYCRILKESPIEVLITGGETLDSCVDDVRDMFKVQQRENILRLGLPPLMCKRAMRKKVHEHADSSQGNLAVGYRGDVATVGKQAYALMLANEVFGGYAGSRLFSVVRERESLAYSVHSIMYRFKGIIAVFAGVNAANFAKAVELISEQ
ncbi:MAG: insulinase family protein, partial [Defluviitaleaceae bacterium]|nr:insulinase family protein [Defluviitaleaceae bacterium]